MKPKQYHIKLKILLPCLFLKNGCQSWGWNLYRLLFLTHFLQQFKLIFYLPSLWPVSISIPVKGVKSVIILTFVAQGSFISKGKINTYKLYVLVSPFWANTEYVFRIKLQLLKVKQSDLLTCWTSILDQHCYLLVFHW